MNNSAEKDNPEVFPENKTGGIHCYKSLISPSNKKKKKIQHIRKQNKNLLSQKMRALFEAADWGVCF